MSSSTEAKHAVWCGLDTDHAGQCSPESPAQEKKAPPQDGGWTSTNTYQTYEDSLNDNVAREVSRACLPVAIYSSCYVTCNARSLMSFLSLRTKHHYAKFPSFPQREIEMVAEQMEELWRAWMPVTHSAFTAHGRVSP